MDSDERESALSCRGDGCRTGCFRDDRFHLGYHDFFCQVAFSCMVYSKKTENSPGSFVFRFFFSGSMCVFFPEYMFPYLDGDGHLRTDQSLSATEIWS